MTAAFHEVSETKSQTSYRSTHSSRSSVLERAREYTRKMDGDAARRARSLERDASSPHGNSSTPRSHSTGRGSNQHSGNRVSTRERAFASVEKENHNNLPRPKPTTPKTPQSTSTFRTNGESSAAKTQEGSQATRPSLRARQQQQGGDGEAQEAIVPPELLVDALSGHEDGLLAIAERLMEHYDGGYDVMGEAIIDAFADVQKLFQHVVEAAHMEGAAFESSRREEEIQELRKQAEAAQNSGLLLDGAAEPAAEEASPAGPVRHDEFIDQDVKDCLSEAIRKGAALKDTNKHRDCYHLYENACQSASSLLPVDSDHRGRLQLSIARAESMSPDKACAILRYAMDDVLRSGMRAGKTTLPDPSKRADVVLTKPKAHPSMNGSTAQAGYVQSSEEQLNSLVEEMKEILEAPVYKDTPLRDVAKRFWVALGESQKQHNRNEERLEQNLGKLKGDFLLARAEWEEKLNRAEEQADLFQRKYSSVKDNGPNMMDEARSMSQRLMSRTGEDGDESTGFQSRGSSTQKPPRGAESIASLGSSMAHHARTLVGQFACAGVNDRTGNVLATEMAEGRQDGRSAHHYTEQQWKEAKKQEESSNPAFELGPNGSNGSADRLRSYRQRQFV